MNSQSTSEIEYDAAPCDKMDAVRCNLNNFDMHHWKWSKNNTPAAIPSTSCKRVCDESDASRSAPSYQNRLLPPYGCHTALSTVLQLSPYPHRQDCVKDEYTFPVRMAEYCCYEKRLQTFQGKWPRYLPGPTIQELARAGFVYLGEGDKVKCFSCGMALHAWEPKDSAYREHARWAPQCHYIRLVGGFDLDVN